jgi:lipid-binding SYLF domain-containing protein
MMCCTSSKDTRSNNQKRSYAIRIRYIRELKSIGLVVSLSVLITSTSGLCAANRLKIRREAREALSQLYSISPAARDLGESAKAILIFPRIVKGNFKTGTQHGYGTLFSRGKAIGYYELGAVSYGIPKGVTEFGWALFFMSEYALDYVLKSSGWKIGTGESIVVVQEDQERKRQAAASANGSADEVVTITPSTARIVRHPSQVTHRPAMNDQQEAAPRPNDLTLDPTYRGFTLIPTTKIRTTLRPKPLHKGIHAFAFGREGLIDRVDLRGAKITPIHPD